MTVHLVTFASNDMSRSAVLCANSGATHGTDYQWLWTPDVLRETDTYKTNQQLFDRPRGCGYWAWKPIIVDSLFVNVTQPYLLKDADVIIYADAGIEFIDNVNYIIDRMDQDIFLFGNQYEHAHWCKRDIVEAIRPYTIVSERELVSDNPSPWGPEYKRTRWEDFGKQVQASVIFFRVSDYTRQFVKEWLDWCLFEGGRLIDDSPSHAPNHPEFQENRHDQAILTTLAYRDGIKLHYWPAVYGPGRHPYPRDGFPDDEGYPALFYHHRRRNHEWESAA